MHNVTKKQLGGVLGIVSTVGLVVLIIRLMVGPYYHDDYALRFSKAGHFEVDGKTYEVTLVPENIRIVDGKLVEIEPYRFEDIEDTND